jgi:DNA-binding phage protein
MFKVYRSYNFKDKDPIIDRLRTIIQDEGTAYTDIAADSGVTANTLYNWFSGPTKRPQYATVMAVVHALGYEATIAKRRKRR